MFDYGTIIDNKTKKLVLLRTLEDEKNMIQYCINEKEIDEAILLLERLQETISDFIEKNEISKNNL